MKVLLVWLVLCIIWSSTWIFIKIGLNDLPPVSFAAWRFVVATVLLLLILLGRRVVLPLNQRFWLVAALTGLFQFFINYGLLFWGEQHISSGLAAVLQATIPAFGLILAQVHLPEEEITALKIIAVTLGIVGVAVIFFEQLQLSGQLAFAGCAAVIVGAFFASYASILTKAFGRNVDSSALLTGQMLCGTISLFLVGLAKEGDPLKFNWTMMAVLCVLYLAIVGSVVAFWLYYWLLKNMDVTKAMMISLVTPFVAVLIGNLTLNESLQWQTLAGGGLILLSVGLTLIKPKHKIEAQNLNESTAIIEAQ